MFGISAGPNLRAQDDLPIEADTLGGAVIAVPVTSDDLRDPRWLRGLSSVIRAADREGAAAVAFDVAVSEPTPFDAFVRIADLVNEAETRTLAFVRSAAVSGGAALVLSADDVIMAPTAIVGAGIPERPAGLEPEDARAELDRQISVLAAKLRAVAAAKGRDPVLAAALIDPESAYSNPDAGIEKPAGRPLTIDAAQAGARIADEPLLSAGTAPSLEAALAAAGLGDAPVVPVAPAGFRVAAARAADPESPGDRVEVEAEDGAPAAAPEPPESDDGAWTFGKSREPSYAGRVVVIPVGEDDLMAQARFDFFKRTIAKADRDGAAAIIFDMNTPGGYAMHTAQLMMQELSSTRVPTFTFVNPAAISAGSLIAIATDTIYMAPTATIGAAAVVSATGGDLMETMSQKVNATMVSIARNAALDHGHNPDIAEAFIDAEKEVIIDGVTISEKGKLLSLNARTATERFSGRPLLAKGIVSSIPQLIAAEDLEGEVLIAEPLGMEAFAHWIQTISVFLILIGIAGAYLEIQSPGFGVPGLVALLAFALFFFGNNLAGKLAGYELVVFFILGLVLIAVEVFLLPGTVIFAALGAALVLGSLFFAMIDQLGFEAIREGTLSAAGIIEVIDGPALAVAIGAVGALALIAAAMAYLPKSPAFKWMVLREAVGGGLSSAAADEESPSAAPTVSLIGLRGEALTPLRPWGKARIGNDVLDVTADSDFIDEAAPIEIIEATPSRIVVAETRGTVE